MTNGTRLCSVEDCGEKAKSRGYCHKHYIYNRFDLCAREDREGLERRFWEKVDRSGGPDSCWPWLAHVRPKGYGLFESKSAHRIAYEFVVGVIPDDLHIDHLCRNTRCVNPKHLEPVTNAENRRRRADAQTHCKYGHEFTPENTTVNRRGARVCRTCTRVQGTENYRRKHAPHLLGRDPSLPQTHCKRGHEFTPENTQVYVASNGKRRRVCQACLKARNRAYYLAHKGA